MSLKLEPVSINNEFLMNEEDLLFFNRYQHEDIAGLSLKLKTTPRQKALLHQISSRQKIKTKLPSFYNNLQIYYPPQVSLEQCSSEMTASFKSTLHSGNTLIDLTAGMGVDSFFLSKNFQHAILIEANETLAGITSHNLASFDDSRNIKIVKGVTASDFLNEYADKADLIYLDPSRRNDSGSKVFRLQDCEPDVISLLPQMFKICDRILIKTSPLLDISLACIALQHVQHVYVLEWNDECKELLFDLDTNFTGDHQIHAVNLDHDRQITFLAQDEKQAVSEYSMPLQYLYEPDSCMLKAGAFNSITRMFPVSKLQQHTHLYTSSDLVYDFPGRKFEILNVVKPSKKDISESLPQNKAHITIRNFPSTVAELRKKWTLADGGNSYLFATTLCNDHKAVVVCSKISE